MPTPREYSIDALPRNLRELVPDVRAGLPLDDRLARSRDNAPGFTTGKWSRARSRREHELDEGSALLRACDTQGAVIVLGCWRRRGGAGREHARGRKCGPRCTGTVVEVWTLLHEPVRSQTGAVADARRKVGRLIEWARENAPVRAGWALPQSAPRAARDPDATGHFLPSRSVPAFFWWRGALAAIARWLLLLARFWSSLTTPPRGASARPEAEQRPRESERASYPGTRWSGQGTRGGVPAPLRALLGRAM